MSSKIFIANFNFFSICLERISDYDHIQYLYPIVKLTNYFLEHLNHRIERNHAKKKTISDYGTDLQPIYQQFIDSWSKINIKEVYYDRQKLHFNDKTSISTFLLNKSNDNESLLLISCLQTLTNLQNEFIKYFHSHARADQCYYRTIPIQSIQPKHLFDFGTNKMREWLIKKGLMINYEYGMSRDIIYDYDEIEWTLRNEIGCLPFIDIKNIRYFNYQFELYDENVFLISDIRIRFQQRLFDEHERTEIKRAIDRIDNDAILQLCGTLEYLLTYLRTVTNQTIIENCTIDTFIRETIHSIVLKNDPIFGRIHLKCIIDFYELIEELIFDQILRENIRKEFRQQSSMIKPLIDMISHDQIIADLDSWIGMLKRLLMRLLSSRMNINFESSLCDYVRRSDMWKGNVTEEKIRTIEIQRDIRLKHAFIILKGLEMIREERHPVSSVTSLSTSTAPRDNRDRRRNDLRD